MREWPLSKTIQLIDVTLRDGHQSLWATRMTTGMMSSIAPKLDEAGFEAIDLVGGAVFDVCVRYLRENPWERMKIVSSWVNRTPLIVHTRGQSLFTFEFFADDLVELAATCFSRNGMRYHTPYDALNDIRNLEIPVHAGKKNGLTVVPGLVFTESPVHDDDYYAKKASELLALGVDGIFIKDPSGLLRPERVKGLVAAIKSKIGDTRLQLHSHCLSGLAPYVALLAADAGVDVIHVAAEPLANGASHPSTQWMIRNLISRGYSVPVELEPVESASELIEFIAKKEGKPLGEIQHYDDFHFHHQVPGGMISNLKYQLSTMGLENRISDILREAGHVRKDLGYPIVVSPFAQYIVTQAALNVMAVDNGEQRYSAVPDEVRLYVTGGYGEIAGEIDPDLYDRISRGAEPKSARPGQYLEAAIPLLIKNCGPFESDEDLLLAAFYNEEIRTMLNSNGPINTDYPIMNTPLKTLLKEVTNRPSIKSFQIHTGSL